MANPIIKIEYGYNYSQSYTLAVNPYPVTIEREILIDRVRQSNGTRVSYQRAKKWTFDFSFQWIPLSMYHSLLTLRDIPEPYRLTLSNMTPAGTYIVQWDGNMSNRYWIPLVGGGFSGEISLVEA